MQEGLKSQYLGIHARQGNMWLRINDDLNRIGEMIIYMRAVIIWEYINKIFEEGGQVGYVA